MKNKLRVFLAIEKQSAEHGGNVSGFSICISTRLGKPAITLKAMNEPGKQILFVLKTADNKENYSSNNPYFSREFFTILDLIKRAEMIGNFGGAYCHQSSNNILKKFRAFLYENFINKFGYLDYFISLFQRSFDVVPLIKEMDSKSPLLLSEIAFNERLLILQNQDLQIPHFYASLPDRLAREGGKDIDILIFSKEYAQPNASRLGYVHFFDIKSNTVIFTICRVISKKTTEFAGNTHTGIEMSTQVYFHSSGTSEILTTPVSNEDGVVLFDWHILENNIRKIYVQDDSTFDNSVWGLMSNWSKSRDKFDSAEKAIIFDKIPEGFRSMEHWMDQPEIYALWRFLENKDAVLSIN